MKICVPITATTMEAAVSDIRQASQVADLLELRIDYLPEPVLEELLQAAGVPVIVTNRVQSEGGHFKGSEPERIALLKQAIDLGAAYIDIEYRHLVPLEKKSTKLIVSYHDFQGTPADLEEIYEKIKTSGADIVKMAVTESDEKDVERMVRLIEKDEVEMIGICMGVTGRRTRLHTGNYLTFACLDRSKGSAPSQFTVEEIRDHLDGKKNSRPGAVSAGWRLGGRTNPILLSGRLSPNSRSKADDGLGHAAGPALLTCPATRLRRTSTADVVPCGRIRSPSPGGIGEEKC